MKNKEKIIKKDKLLTANRYPLNPTLIAIAGPSASGKTFLAERLAVKLGKAQTVLVSQDRYYKDWSRLPFDKREKINFDEPRAFDFNLMGKQFQQLKKGCSVDVPVYSYRLHKRLSRSYELSPKRYVIVEGLLPFYPEDLPKIFDLKIYIDVDESTSLARRIRRDVRFRGETIESVCARFFRDVLPMQKMYVEKQKKYADIVVDGEDSLDKKLGILCKAVKELSK